MYRLLSLTFLAFTACEFSAIVEGTITIDPDLAPQSGNLLIIPTGLATETDEAWTPIGEFGQGATDPYVAGDLSYHYRWQQFGEAPHLLFFAAFIDLNNNTTLDSGEPYGEFTSNPLVDAPSGVRAPASTADIAIDNLAP